MSITQIKDTLFKQATIFQTGGLLPTEKLGESWIGRFYGEKKEKLYHLILNLFAQYSYTNYPMYQRN